MYQPPEKPKPRSNKVQATEAKDEAKAVMGGEVVTKDVEDEAGDSTFHHTHRQFKTSRDKYIVLKWS